MAKAIPQSLIVEIIAKKLFLAENLDESNQPGRLAPRYPLDNHRNPRRIDVADRAVIPIQQRRIVLDQSRVQKQLDKNMGHQAAHMVVERRTQVLNSSPKVRAEAREGGVDVKTGVVLVMPKDAMNNLREIRAFVIDPPDQLVRRQPDAPVGNAEPIGKRCSRKEIRLINERETVSKIVHAPPSGFERSSPPVAMLSECRRDGRTAKVQTLHRLASPRAFPIEHSGGFARRSAGATRTFRSDGLSLGCDADNEETRDNGERRHKVNASTATEEECYAGAPPAEFLPTFEKPTARTRRRTHPYLWMLIAAVSFAVMGALTHAAGAEIDWRIIAIVRATLACLFAGILAYWAGAKLVVRGSPTLWMRSIAGSISLACTFYALTRLPVGDTLTLTNMFPLWVVVLSVPLLGQWPTAGVWMAAGVGMAGVVFIQQPHFQDDNTLPGLAAFLASFTSAIAMIGLHKLKAVDPRAIVAHFSGVAVLTMALLIGLPGASPIQFENFDARLVAILVGVGVTATAGQLAITRAFATGSPSKVSVVALTQVLFGAGFDRVLWNRAFDAATLIGMGLILAATAWVLVHRRP